MDLKGFETIRDVAAPELVMPEPAEGEDLRFVTIDNVGGSSAALFERLGKAGLLADVTRPSLVDGPSLEVYMSAERSITFIDRNVQEQVDYNFDHLKEDDLQLIRGIEEAEDGISLVSALHEAGFTQDDIAEAGDWSRNTIKAYISGHRNRGKSGNTVGTRFYTTVNGIRNAFLGLVGEEGFSLDKARFTLALFYKAGAEKSLKDPFVLDNDIRKMVERLYDK
jgi:hypothetical protein